MRFRAALIAKEGARRLVERTVEIAKKKGGFSSGALRAALDSSPLWGAARVEDTYNLLGQALRKALSVIAHQPEKDLANVAAEAGAQTVGITPANVPESGVTEAIAADLEPQNVKLIELHIDRAYLNSQMVQKRPEGLTIICKAWPVYNGKHFDKTAFVLDWDTHLIRCPNQVSIPFSPGKVVHFPQQQCEVCPLRSCCTTSVKGRTVSIHPDESLLQELRQRQQTPAGRARLRERVAVEHSLAQIGQWQGDRARYLGTRKNLFDLRRMAVVHNLHVIARMSQPDIEQAA